MDQACWGAPAAGTLLVLCWYSVGTPVAILLVLCSYYVSILLVFGLSGWWWVVAVGVYRLWNGHCPNHRPTAPVLRASSAEAW